MCLPDFSEGHMVLGFRKMVRTHSFNVSGSASSRPGGYLLI